MTTLLTFRDNMKGFCSRYDYILTPILKFIVAFCVFMNINARTGYMEALNSWFIVFLLSFICAFLPFEFIVGLGFTVIILQAFKASLDACLIGIALILIFYFAYMRFVPKTGLIVLLVPLFYAVHLTYAIPVLLGFLVGPVAIIPAAFGLVLYDYEKELADLVKVLATVTEDDEKVQGYLYILKGILADKEMLLTIVVFAIVILVTYLIYRMSSEYAWVVAFVAGSILNIVCFLVGSVLLSVKIGLVPVLLESIVGILLAIVIQFIKGVVDYQRTEILQFEDDNYYYYVKAVPKLSITVKNENVKHINSKSN